LYWDEPCLKHRGKYAEVRKKIKFMGGKEVTGKNKPGKFILETLLQE